ncbi:MAG TPA: flagellar motor switch protein FliN [Jatrophihabitans sp.]|nr:flagellar motor switch protein FliN [Jatrophihabitans sp.]
MTQTMSTSELARQAALAALANLPISDPLELGEPSSDLSRLSFDGVAVTARFTGGHSGDVLIAVERALTDALQNSPLGALDVSAALAPALSAAAGAAGTVQTGPGQPLEPATALAALLGKPGAWVVPLLHQGVTRALVGIVITTEPATTGAQAPHYPSPEELRAGATNGAPARRTAIRNGLDLLRDVSMDVTAQIGSTRMTISELLALNEGAVVELDRAAGAPADLLVNGHLIARGEVVVIDENFALRITEIVADETVPPLS